MVFSVVLGSYTIASETLPTFHWRQQMELGLGRNVSTFTCETFPSYFMKEAAPETATPWWNWMPPPADQHGDLFMRHQQQRLTCFN